MKLLQRPVNRALFDAVGISSRDPRIQALWTGLTLVAMLVAPLWSPEHLGWFWLWYGLVVAYIAVAFLFWIWRWHRNA